MDVNSAPHLLNPHPPPVVVRDGGLRHVEVGILLEAGGDLEEDLGFALLVGCEGDVHVVGGGYNALRTGEVLHLNSLDQPEQKVMLMKNILPLLWTNRPGAVNLCN